MQLGEIINRPNRSLYEQGELIYVVQQYIKIRKGIDVKIDLLRGADIYTPFGQMHYVTECQKLSQAFNFAAGWFKQNGY